MRYTIKPKTTLYKNVEYRSRLEAKWAAFFDIIRWKYIYEPFDLKGWSPDFLIRTRPAMPDILVEIKPITHICDETLDKMQKSINPDDHNKYELLLLGVSPFDCELGEGLKSIGWCAEYSDSHWYSSEAVICDWGYLFKDKKMRIGYCSSQHSFQDRISGEYDGCTPGYDLLPQVIDQCFAEATNAVKFYY